MPSTMARLLWFFVSLWTLSSAAAAAETVATDCSSVIPSVMGCLGFVSDGSTDPKPTKDCCVGIGAVIKDMPDCLCEALKVAPTVGNLNMTRILGLPDACSLKTPDLECIRNATHPSAPVPAPQMPSPSPSPSTTPAPSHSPPATPVAPVLPKTPPTPSPQPSVPTPPATPAAAPSPPTDPVDAPAPAPNGTSKSTDASIIATCMALAGSMLIVLSGLMS